MRHKRPNVVFIMTDQQRRDTLGCYGNTLMETPALDQLAAESVVLDHFYVNNPVCVPSRCSFLTGRYPNAHHSRDLKSPLDFREMHLFKILKEAGYRNGLSGKNHALSQQELEKFDFVYYKGHEKTPISDPKLQSYGSCVDPISPEKYTTHLVAEQGKKFIEESVRMEQPFCLWLSFPDPHTRFMVPEPYASQIDREKIVEPVEPSLHPSKPLSQQLIHDLVGASDATKEDIEEMIAIYHGMVAFIDEQVGEVLETIKKLDKDEDTIIIFTSDHGEYLGDHGMVRKSWHFYDCLLRVPFMIRWKGEIKPSFIKHTMAESVDLLPTIIELLGLSLPEHVQGRSFRGLLNDETSSHKQAVFAEAGHPGQTISVRSVQEWNEKQKQQKVPGWSIGAQQGKMVRTLDWKYCFYGDGEGELYDLQEDPGETVNLYGDKSLIMKQLEMSELLIHTMMDAQDSRLPEKAVFGKEIKNM